MGKPVGFPAENFMTKEDNNRWTDLFVVMMALGILVPHLFIWFWIVAK